MYTEAVTVFKRNLPHKPIASKTTDKITEEVSLLPLAKVQSEVTEEVEEPISLSPPDGPASDTLGTRTLPLQRLSILVFPEAGSSEGGELLEASLGKLKKDFFFYCGIY